MPITAPPIEKLPKPTLLIGDQRIDDSSGGVFDHVYGATGKRTANVTLAGPREIDLAVQAARSVTRVAAMEVAGSGVRVNGIASGITDMGKTYELLPPSLLADLGRIIPAQRLGNARDIAGMVSFLCSDAAEYVNGQTLTVDGAMTAGLWAVSSIMAAGLSEG